MPRLIRHLYRLSEQHFFVKAVFDNPEVLPAAVDRTKIRRVLDAAAGTAIWALDLSAQSFASAYEIFASDITLSKFPTKDVLDKAGIKTFEQDITKPFPEGLRGTFDLVHASALVMALTEDGWKSMLKNVYDLLGEIPRSSVKLHDGSSLCSSRRLPSPCRLGPACIYCRRHLTA